MKKSITSTSGSIEPSEQQIQNEILRTFMGKGGPEWLLCWRNNTGQVKTHGRYVRFGMIGQADLSGLLAPNGRRLEIEVKTPKGRQSENQEIFERNIVLYGGVYILARSVDDVWAALEKEGYSR